MLSSKVEYRAVIRYVYLKGKTGKEIHGELADVYGSSAQSYAQVKFWVGEFKREYATVHTCKVAMDAVERNGYELITHPAYSPDLAPSDFFLFPNLKKDIRGLHFRSDEEVVTAVEEWVNGKDPDFYSSGLMALEHHWSKCITLEGNYIEKKRWISTGNKLGWLLIDSPS